MKTILCYGDSNTWGYIPGTGNRLSKNDRWGGILQKKLGDSWHVIEEGLNGRTTVRDDPVEPYKNGINYLPISLLSHKPIDTLIFMLGTNDLRARNCMSAQDSARGIARLIHLSRTLDYTPYSPPKRIIVVIPPPLTDLAPEYIDLFKGAITKSKELATAYKDSCLALDVDMIDSSEFIEASAGDGVHFDQNEHIAIADKLASLLQAPIRAT